jgi:hypothetical protein
MESFRVDKAGAQASLARRSFHRIGQLPDGRGGPVFREASMRIALLLAAAPLCATANAQFGNFLKNLDPGKVIDNVKKVAEANKEYTQEEEVQLGQGITAGLLGAAPLSQG